MLKNFSNLPYTRSVDMVIRERKEKGHGGGE
jgi:hypothetical protein